MLPKRGIGHGKRQRPRAGEGAGARAGAGAGARTRRLPEGKALCLQLQLPCPRPSVTVLLSPSLFLDHPTHPMSAFSTSATVLAATPSVSHSQPGPPRQQKSTTVLDCGAFHNLFWWPECTGGGKFPVCTCAFLYHMWMAQASNGWVWLSSRWLLFGALLLLDAVQVLSPVFAFWFRACPILIR